MAWFGPQKNLGPILGFKLNMSWISTNLWPGTGNQIRHEKWISANLWQESGFQLCKFNMRIESQQTVARNYVSSLAWSGSQQTCGPNLGFQLKMRFESQQAFGPNLGFKLSKTWLSTNRWPESGFQIHHETRIKTSPWPESGFQVSMNLNRETNNKPLARLWVSSLPWFGSQQTFGLYLGFMFSMVWLLTNLSPKSGFTF